MKYENLRAQFNDSGECFYFRNFSIEDFYTEIELYNDKNIEDQIFQLINTPFLITGHPLLKFYLLLNKNKAYFIINAQHTLIDGIALKILSHEICNTYNHLINNQEVVFDSSESFSQYINFEKSKSNTANSQAASKFWQDFLKDTPLSVKLPISHEARITDSENRTIYFKSTFFQTRSIRELAAQSRTTVFVVLASLYALHLSKYFNQKKLLISYPVNMRPRACAEVVGCFVNNLPLKIIINKEHQKLTDIINEIAQQRSDVSPYSWYSLTDIIKDQRKLREQLELDILNVGFAVTNLNVKPVVFYGVDTENIQIPWSGKAIYHICLQYDPSLGDEIFFRLEYQKNKLDFHIIDSFVDSFKILLQKVVDGDFLLKDYSYLSNSERLKIFDVWSKFETFSNNKTLNKLFEEQVEISKNNVALFYEERQVSYLELNRKANQLARYIRLKYNENAHQSLNPKNFILLYLDRDIEQVLAILAVLKAGAAYVPIAVDYPIERIRHILEDTNAKIVLTQASYLETLNEYFENSYEAEFLAIDEDCYNEQNNENLPAFNQASDIAYVIYTSGTTGQPKGVLQPHANVMRLFTSTESDFRFSKNDRWILCHSYAFDFSVWEMWGALIYGGSLVIPTTQQIINIPEFFNVCLHHKITVLNQTPTSFYQFSQIMFNANQYTLTSLRYIILGGEALKVGQLKYWWQYYKEKKLNTELINMYGITETTVHVTLKRLTASDNETICNIGRPLRDLVVYVLNEELESVPIGIEGGLYVGGAGVAVGYLNRPELTNEKFINNFFVSCVFYSHSNSDSTLIRTPILF